MNIISWSATVLVFVSATGLLLSRDWRLSLALLAVQYLGTFWLVFQHWPLGMASIKLVTGWMAIATLGITRLGLQQYKTEVEQFWPRGRLFRGFTAGIVLVIVLAVTPEVDAIIPGIGLPVIAGSLALIGLGVFHLGITSQRLRVILGLLTLLSGFEILYAAIESSVLVAALLAVVNLGLALVGSYLLSAQTVEVSE